MLKHLLSSGANADQPDPRDTQQQQQYHSYTQQSFAPEYKYEHDPPPATTTQSPGVDNAPNKFSYEQPQPSGFSVLTSTANNNNIICHGPEYSTVPAMADDLSYEPTSDTSDFLSSTFSLLTSDSLANQSANGEWPQYSLEQLESNKQPPRVFYDPNQQIYYSQPNVYAPQYLNGAHSHDDHIHQQQMHEMQAMHHADSMEPCEKRAKKGNGPSARNCQLEYTENFKRFINISTQGLNSATSTTSNSATTPQRSLSANNSDSGVQSPADSEESDSTTGGGQTIQCPACKSVYNSARSLTGHIGRTEKCRELIGRDYLDEIAKMGKSGCIPDPSAGEGISPVCPHCNRFISHYKGNIRRHVNSCKKTPGRKDSGASALEPTGSNSSNASLASYDTSTPNPPQHDEHQTQPCSSNNKDIHLDYTLQPMQNHLIHQQHPIHFAHPDERHLPPTHHQVPPYHLIPPLHHQPLGMPQHQMTLVTHLQPPGSHHMHMYQQHQAHPSMDYMSYEQMPMHQHIPVPQQQQSATQHYEITYVRTPPENPIQHANPIAPNVEAPVVPKMPKMKHNGMVPASDAYICCWCTFSTVYKGNMKRHLISCHNCTDELLRKYNFELERLRKSNPHPATIECLPFIEIKPPQPPGTRRPRNPPNNKSLGRPKKNNSTSSDKSVASESVPQQFDRIKPDYLVEPSSQLQYNILQSQQQPIKIEYQAAPMGFMGTPGNGQLLHAAANTNPAYLIKDCANDSGLGMELNDYTDSALHQPQALPGY